MIPYPRSSLSSTPMAAGQQQDYEMCGADGGGNNSSSIFNFVMTSAYDNNKITTNNNSAMDLSQSPKISPTVALTAAAAKKIVAESKVVNNNSSNGRNSNEATDATKLTYRDMNSNNKSVVKAEAGFDNTPSYIKYNPTALSDSHR